MGTELQYALDPLATLPQNDRNAVTVAFKTSNPWAYSRQRFLEENRTGSDKIQESMDKSLEQYNRESVRKTMLKQEEIFKDQVRELHRLYSVQKMLMAELQSKETKLPSPANTSPASFHVGRHYLDVDPGTGYWTRATCSTAHRSPFSNNHCPTTQTNPGHSLDQLYKVRANPSSQELSSCSKDTSRLQWGFDLERPAGEDISTDVSTIEDQVPVTQRPMKNKMTVDGPQDPFFYTDRESDVELTLSIGYCSNKKKMKHRSSSNLELGCSELNPDETRQLIPSMSVRSDREEECSNTAGASLDRGSLQRPHWLFQALSLNRT
ncbi:uncharacterized protein LOC131217197 [Magnolia sinica]|uniref:uncharacterized protein LOC131217197 n=1 Tax=Magnolia sinica TaxID=86752 RepID=UPI00265ADD26|nr:uncharacterized protein LOC131217197 [Magnolia sinica]